jgi:biopolymer transport protein ExbB/TolQ
MIEAFQSGGVLMWPLLLVGVGVLVLALRVVWLLGARGSRSAEAESSLQAILFWGGMSVLLGLIGTVIGVVQMTQAIALAGRVHPPLVWGGFGVSLVTLILGMLIFAVAALLWFPLRLWARRLPASGAAGGG